MPIIEKPVVDEIVFCRGNFDLLFWYTAQAFSALWLSLGVMWPRHLVMLSTYFSLGSYVRCTC